MDLQQSGNYHHRHHLQPPPPPQPSRYVPIHSSQSRLPSNPPPSMYLQPYHHHHQHHLPPPPPPPRSFHPPPIPPPPPSSYNHSQFTFPNSPTPDRHSFWNLPQRDVNRIDSRFDHRNRFDPDPDNGYSTNRGFTNFRDEFSGGYRFKEEFSDNHRVIESREEDRIRGYIATTDNFGDSLTSSRGLGFGKDGKFWDVPSNSRGLGFENRDNFRDMFSDSRGLDLENDLFSLKEDNARREFYRHQQERSRGANTIDSSGDFRMNNYDLDDGDERMVPRKRIARSRGNERTPPRQVQKKSAFLRIQMGKPGYRSREDRDEIKFQSSSCFDESISSPFKGKYSASEKDQKIEEEGEGRELKELSSVELDVSFKSNSLVAKAITTTPTSSAANSSCKNKKIRKLIMPDTKELSSPKSNLSADSVKLEEKEAATGSGKADDILVKQPCSDGTVTPLGKRMAVRSPGDKVSAKVVRSSGDKVSVKGSEDSSAAKSSPRITKRKKIIKKVPASVPIMSISQPSVELDQFKKGSSAASNPDKETTPAKPSVPVQCELLNISPRNIVFCEVSADVDSCNRSFSTLNKDADCTLILDPSTCQDENDYGGSVDADRIANNLVITPDSNSCLTPQNCSSLDNGGVNNTIRKSLQSGMGIDEGYDNNLSSLRERKINDVAAINRSSGLGSNSASSSDSNVSRLQGATSPSSINAMNSDGRQPFPNEVSSYLGHCLMEGVENNTSSVENIVHQGPLCSEVYLNGSNNSVLDGTKSCPCSRAMSMENGPIHGCSSSSNEVITFLDRECEPNIKNKRKERSPLVDTLVNKMEQESVVTSTDSGNAKLKNLAEDVSHANEDNMFCSRILDVHSQSTCEDVGVFVKASLDGLPVNVLSSHDEENGFCISPSSKLAKNGKKRRLLAEHYSVALDGELSMSDADRCPIFHKNVAQRDEIPESIICNVRNASLSPSLEQGILICGNSVTENKLIASDVLSPSSLDQVDRQIENGTQMTIASHQLDMESVNEDDVDICIVEEDIVKVNSLPLGLQSSCSNQTLYDTEKGYENIFSEKENLPSVSSFDFLSSPGEGSTIKDESMESDPDTLSVAGSPVSVDPNMIKSSLEPSYAYDGREEKSVVGMDLDNDLQLEKSSSTGAVKLPTPQTITKRMSHNQKSLSLTAKFLPKHPTYSVPKLYYGHSSVVFNNSKNSAATAHIIKSRTWHKSSNPSSNLLPGKKSAVPLVKPMQNQNENVDNASYIRRGNSLVRKPFAPSVPAKGSHDLTSIVSVENRNSGGSGCTVDLAEPQTTARKLQITASLFTPHISKLLPGVRSSDCIVSSSVSNACSPSDEPNFSGTMSDPMICTEDKGVLDSSACTMESSGLPVSETVKSSKVKSSSNDGNSTSSKMSTITYVKHKSNQLIASSRQSNMVQKGVEASNSDGYYKKKKNQLIRMPLEVDKNDSVPDEILQSGGQTACKFPTVRQPGKGLCKPSKFSLVWKLGGTQPSKDITSSLQRHVFPSRVPWKKTNWKHFMRNSSMTSSSSISRRLLLLRRRDTLYTRSTHGLSLWKSKVLSVGGSSLKWSKSIEMRSKKASEEATRAVAAAEREKREQSDLNFVKSAARNKNQSSRKCTKSVKLHPGGRIFRVGSFRYRMDSSKKTLQRIPDQPSHPDALQDKDARKSYVPRRLVIGNEPYVRIGNGNQLVRDPKKRARTLASEKVRWSLHTARLRLARKRKYCQFFTRFGKCNKNDGKCPYIHDPSKVSVCTKFLKGLCSNPDCKLTHKVIPERMPDCSFFLLGLCSNGNCPYRHVNVGPNASVCEGFLKGYCAQGNECRNKHSYVCPLFEATGACAQGSKCKFHHPKKSHGKKKKLSREEKNGQGRYFGSPQIDVVDSRTAVSVKPSTMVNEDAPFDGEALDFISLDVSDEDGEETTFWVRSDGSQSNATDLEEDALDELIRPIRLLKRNLTSS